MKKYLLLILFIILVSMLVIIINLNFKNFRNKFINFEKTTDIKKSNTQKNDKSDEKTEFTIIGVGDIMLGSNYPFEYLLPENDANILKNTQNILKNADIDDKELLKIEAIIQSMTKQERLDPSIINGSRKIRIH